MDVAVRELKQHLSRYLDRAARGEAIRITERGLPKAILGPVQGVSRLADGIREGWVAQAEGEPIASVRRVRSRRRIGEVLIEDREG